MTQPILMESNEIRLRDGRSVMFSVEEFRNGLVRIEAFAIQPNDVDLTLFSAYFPKESWIPIS